jgi:hypothetical protein
MKSLSPLQLAQQLFEDIIKTGKYLDEPKLQESFSGKELSLKDKENIDKKYREDNPDGHSYLRIMREYKIRDEILNYNRFLRFIREMYRPAFGKESNHTYVKAVKRYWEEVGKDRKNATAEWRAYFEFRFFISLKRFFKNNYYRIDEKKNTINRPPSVSVNFIPWSFIGNSTFPPYRMHNAVKDSILAEISEEKGEIIIRPLSKKEIKELKKDGFKKEDYQGLGKLQDNGKIIRYLSKEKIYNIREKAFDSGLATGQRNYSFVWGITRNNITTIFYFDKVEKVKNLMNIYEIDPDAAGPHSEGNAKFVGKCLIDATHRGDNTKALIEEHEEKDSIIYQLKRNEDERERSYQYAFMRFLIRSGIFNPESSAYLKDETAIKPEYKNLLEGLGKERSESKKSLQEILKAQYKTSATRKGFDFNEKYTEQEDEDLDWLISIIDENDPTVINHRVATFELGMFSLTQEATTINHIYWFPLITNFRDRITGGTVFLNTDTRIGMKDDDPITPNTAVPQPLISSLFFFMGLIDDKQQKEIEETIRQPAETAAAVSIMSRNVSHNIASHVLSYIKNILKVEELMLEKGVFANLIIQENGIFKINEKVFENGQLKQNAFISPFMRAIGELLGYFQERQDYISAIASGWHLYYDKVHFRDAVYKYFAGHKKIESLSLQESENQESLILDYIAYSEGYKREDIIITASKNGYEKDLDTLDIALPVGITGRQGLYTIFENLIRNTAKHGTSKEDRGGQLKLHIEVRDYNQKYYKVELRDNSHNLDVDKMAMINQILTRPLTKEDGTIDEMHKGVKEMQIAAAWLRGIKPYDLGAETVEDNLPILELSKNEEGLTYTFYLLKPKSIVIYVAAETAIKEADGTFKEGLAYLANVDYKVYTGRISAEDLAYQFVVLHDSLSKAAVKKLTAAGPVRVIDGVSNDKLREVDNIIDLETQLFIRGLNKEGNYISRKGIKPSDLRIGIYDNEANINGRSTAELELVKIHLEPTPVYNNCDILFRKHNDTRGDFENFEALPQASNMIFVEGITGSNSTNRLLREEEITVNWCHRMREVALTRILFIDERMWKQIRQEDRGEINEKRIKFEKAKLARKNIYLLTAEEHDGDFEFLDLNREVVATMNREGQFEWLDGTPTPYNFLTIHQGILDKMINYCKEELAERNITQPISRADYVFENFRKVFQANFRYLIHSGRAKTPTLPKDTAFIQLSTLEAAMADCKYTLTSLLYAAITE